MHNPIIFIGYRIDDKNIRDILKTIFSYVEPNSEQGKKIESNFLFIQRQQDSQNIDVTDYEIEVEDGVRIKTQKIATNDFSSIYRALADLKLKCSIANIKKVEDVFHKIRIGERSSIRVSIATDYEDLPDDQMVLAIGHLQIETANVARMLPQKVIDKVNEKIDKNVMKEKFNQHDHTILTKVFEIKGVKGDKTYTKPPKTKYCIFDEANTKDVYTEAWVDFLVGNINNGKLSKAE
ncbi:hypothetical protein K2X05_01330 [bacterium]|nr:hypothetical protein [bacterium]